MRFGDLGKYRDKFRELVVSSPMATEVPHILHDLHSPFGVKYEMVHEARNVALHEGALARHLTVNAVELSLVVEEALAFWAPR